MTFYDVCARYLFNAPTIWATELSVYLLQLMVFLPMGALLGENGHLASTLVTDQLSPRNRRIAQRIAFVAVAVFAALQIRYGWNFTAHAWRMGQTSPSLLAVPLWIPNGLVPLGFLLLLVNAVVAFIRPPAPVSHAEPA
jgi:C4-dicarboxylate transporter, DctQ subunit